MTKIEYYTHPVYGKFKLITRPMKEYFWVYGGNACRHTAWRRYVGSRDAELTGNITYMVMKKGVEPTTENSYGAKRSVIHAFHNDYQKILDNSKRKFTKYLRKHKEDDAH